MAAAAIGRAVVVAVAALAVIVVGTRGIGIDGIVPPTKGAHDISSRFNGLGNHLWVDFRGDIRGVGGQSPQAEAGAILLPAETPEEFWNQVHVFNFSPKPFLPTPCTGR